MRRGSTDSGMPAARRIWPTRRSLDPRGLRQFFSHDGRGPAAEEIASTAAGVFHAGFHSAPM